MVIVSATSTVTSFLMLKLSSVDGRNCVGEVYLSCVVRKPVFAYAKTKTQISFAVTAKQISAFVFAT